MTEFKVGDVVEWAGVRGCVLELCHSDEGREPSLRILFDSVAGWFHFTLDGRYGTWHKEPSLKLIERPKKKVTKTVEAWTNVYPESFSYRYMFISKESADRLANEERIACVKLTGTYEVEE